MSQKDNPSCGDEISFTGHIENGVVIDIAYQGAGCIVSQGAASLLCDYARGKKVSDLLAITTDDILSILELKLGPNRMQCIQLPLAAMHEALQTYNAHAQ